MTIIAPMTRPSSSPGEVQPLTALLLYQVEQRIIGTLHPLTAMARDRMSAPRPMIPLLRVKCRIFTILKILYHAFFLT